MNVLALNPGSGSLRWKLFAGGPVGRGGSEVLLDQGAADRVRDRETVAAAERAIEACLVRGLDAIACRVVHGGERHSAPELATRELIADVRALAELAPLHNEVAASVLEAALERAPRARVLAVFDTAFHRTMPEVARRYALPDEAGADVRRHGFHGIAHRWASSELYRLARRGPAGTRALSCHLGGGASVCALRDGISVDTSMGLTPLEGLMMSTRCGDLDPGAVLHLLSRGRSLEEVHEMLHQRSGLLGLSGTSGDLRALEPAAAAGDARAAFALEAYAYRFRKLVGAYAVALGGLDLVVLSGALAENWAPFRARLCAGLELLGLRLDERRNAAARPDAPARLDADGSRVEVWLVPADEEREIAREVLALPPPKAP